MTKSRQLSVALGWWNSQSRWQRWAVVVLMLAFVSAIAYEQGQGHDVTPILAGLGAYAAFGLVAWLLVWSANQVQKRVEAALRRAGLWDALQRAFFATEKAATWAIRSALWVTGAALLAVVAYLILDGIRSSIHSMSPSAAIILGSLIIAWAIVSNRPR